MINEDAFTKNCTGDCVTGDTILFSEAVFSGSFKKPVYRGDRRIVAKIVKDSYGAGKQQHTFTLEILDSDGFDPLKPGTKTTRKGRNVYRNGTSRLPWEDESLRNAAADEKHARGDAARAERAARKEEEGRF